MIRLRSFSPLRAALRQGRSASGSCRSTIDPDAACSRCSCGPMNPDRPGVRRSTHRSSFGRRRDRTRRAPSCGSARRCQRLCARLDIHRAFAEAVAWGDCKLKRLGARRHAPPSSRGFRKEAFAGGRSPCRGDRKRILSCGGDRASYQASPDSDPMQVRIIAHAKIKTDTIDAKALAQLYASVF